MGFNRELHPTGHIHILLASDFRMFQFLQFLRVLFKVFAVFCVLQRFCSSVPSAIQPESQNAVKHNEHIVKNTIAKSEE